METRSTVSTRYRHVVALSLLFCLSLPCFADVLSGIAQDADLGSHNSGGWLFGLIPGVISLGFFAAVFFGMIHTWRKRRQDKTEESEPIGGFSGFFFSLPAYGAVALFVALPIAVALKALGACDTYMDAFPTVWVCVTAAIFYFNHT